MQFYVVFSAFDLNSGNQTAGLIQLPEEPDKAASITGFSVYPYRDFVSCAHLDGKYEDCQLRPGDIIEFEDDKFTIGVFDNFVEALEYVQELAKETMLGDDDDENPDNLD